MAEGVNERTFLKFGVFQKETTSFQGHLSAIMIHLHCVVWEKSVLNLYDNPVFIPTLSSHTHTQDTWDTSMYQQNEHFAKRTSQIGNVSFLGFSIKHLNSSFMGTLVSRTKINGFLQRRPQNIRLNYREMIYSPVGID